VGGVGDDKQLCFSHAGNIMSPVPFSPSFLFPLSLPPLLFLRIIHGKENVASEGVFLLQIRDFGAPRAAVRWGLVST